MLVATSSRSGGGAADIKNVEQLSGCFDDDTTVANTRAEGKRNGVEEGMTRGEERRGEERRGEVREKEAVVEEGEEEKREKRWPGRVCM